MPRDKIAFIAASLRALGKSGEPVEASELRGLIGILDDVWTELGEAKAT